MYNHFIILYKGDETAEDCADTKKCSEMIEKAWLSGPCTKQEKLKNKCQKTCDLCKSFINLRILKDVSCRSKDFHKLDIIQEVLSISHKFLKVLKMC